MNLPVILTIAGCTALLVGLFGGGVKAKEIEVPQISLLPRILSSVTGMVLIGVAIWISQIPPTEAPSAQILPIEVPPTQTLLPTIVPPTAVPPTDVPPTKVPPTEVPPPTVNNLAPVIDRVDLRYINSAGTTTVYQDVYFHDEDGDVNYVTYQITYISPGYSAETKNGVVEVPTEQQKSGGLFTGEWTCNGIYDVRLLVTVYDLAGHQSNSLSYTMNCY